METPSQIFLVFGWKATTLELGIKPHLNNNGVKNLQEGTNGMLSRKFSFSRS